MHVATEKRNQKAKSQDDVLDKQSATKKRDQKPRNQSSALDKQSPKISSRCQTS